jgi:hypothetical protein
MSMHLERSYLNTISTKKRTKTVTKAQQAEFEQGWRDRNKMLKEIGLPKESFEDYLDWLHGRGKKDKKTKQTEYKPVQPKLVSKTSEKRAEEVDTIKGIHTSVALDRSAPKPIPKATVNSPEHWVTGPTSSKDAPVYTGTKVLGIGTMHKSNAVPIFSDDEAKDISTMRR